MLDPNIALILSTLLGGILTIIGGFAANYYVQRTASNSEKRKETRLLLEQLTETLQNTLVIANLLNRKMYFQEKLEDEPLEIIHNTNKIRAITMLYLNELKEDSVRFAESSLNLYYLSNTYKEEYELYEFRDELKEICQSIEDEGSDFITSIIDFVAKNGYN